MGLLHLNNEDKVQAASFYNDFGSWIKKRFPFRVQKISIDGGFSCPNRDGKISYGGCSFCDNNTFSPSYCFMGHSISQQIETGKSFFSRKYPNMKYLAYFQSFSNTYAELDVLKKRYEEALCCEDVVGIVIGTRPDCISEEILDYLEWLNGQTFLIVEYGIESTNDNVLKLINRGHDFTCAENAICNTADRGIVTSGHVIIGLPGDDETTVEQQAKCISATKLSILKLHQLQIIRGTRLAKIFEEFPFPVYSADEYIKFIGEYICYLRPELVLERFVSQSPKHMVIAPDWGLKNHEFADRLTNYLKKNKIYQGMKL